MTIPCTIAGLLPEYLYRRLPPVETERVRRHIADCPACAAAYEYELALSQLARGADAPAPPHLFAAIMGEVHVTPQAMPHFRVTVFDVLLAIAATAACVGVFLGLDGLRVRGVTVAGVQMAVGDLLDTDIARVALAFGLWSLAGLAVVAGVTFAAFVLRPAAGERA